MGVTSASVNAACTSSGGWRGASTMASSAAASGSTSVRKAWRTTRAAGQRSRQAWWASMPPASTAISSSSHTVPGTWPVCNKAIVKAPKATNSPCGMKTTRVTANTSTRASATSA